MSKTDKMYFVEKIKIASNYQEMFILLMMGSYIKAVRCFLCHEIDRNEKEYYSLLATEVEK